MRRQTRDIPKRRPLGPWLLLLPVLLAPLLTSCSDDSPAPPLRGDAGRDGRPSDSAPTADGAPLRDGVDPRCPLGGPCVLKAAGEGQHADDVLVVGELLTLTGHDLQGVEAVYLGMTSAPIVSKNATQVICRIPPGISASNQSVEVKFGAAYRKSDPVTIRRLALATASDGTKLQIFDATNHGVSDGLTLDEAPSERPAVDATGRYLVVVGNSKLVLVSLPREQVATVHGIVGNTVRSWTIDEAARRLLVATADGKLHSVELDTFPSLSAQEITAAPTSAAVLVAGPELLVGLHPRTASGEGSFWYAKPTLASFSWVQGASQPYLVGTGQELALLEMTARDGLVAALVEEGGAPRLALLKVAGAQLASPVDLAASGAFGVTVAAGGAFAALAREADSPALSYAPAAGGALQTIALGGTGPSHVLARSLPSRPATVLALVGAKPSGAFSGTALEVVDLAAGKRLTASGEAVLKQADLRDACGDPAAVRVHVLGRVSAGSAVSYRSYALAVSGSAASLSEIHPYRDLPSSADYRWLVIQP